MASSMTSSMGYMMAYISCSTAWPVAAWPVAWAAVWHVAYSVALQPPEHERLSLMTVIGLVPALAAHLSWCAPAGAMPSLQTRDAYNWVRSEDIFTMMFTFYAMMNPLKAIANVSAGESG